MPWPLWLVPDPTFQTPVLPLFSQGAPSQKQGHTKALRSVIFLRDDRVLSTGGDGMICVFDLESVPAPGTVLLPEQSIEATSADSTSKWVLCLCLLRACSQFSPSPCSSHLVKRATSPPDSRSLSHAR